MIDDQPIRSTPITQSVCPDPSSIELSGGYAVQPVAAAPLSTKKLAIMQPNAGHMIQ